MPSHLGYGFSSPPPPLDQNYGLPEMADLIDKLMVGLGFGGGYIVQGGDIGSQVGRVMAATKGTVKGTTPHGI